MYTKQNLNKSQKKLKTAVTVGDLKEILNGYADDVPVYHSAMRVDGAVLSSRVSVQFLSDSNGSSTGHNEIRLLPLLSYQQDLSIAKKREEEKYTRDDPFNEDMSDGHKYPSFAPEEPDSL